MSSLYAEHLSESLPLVIQQSIQQKNFMDDFISCIKNRISAQQSYAKNLTNIEQYLHKQLNKPSLWKGQELTSIGFLFAALQSDVTRRSYQINSFVQQLKQQILIPTKELFNIQTTQSKKIQKDGKVIDKQNRQIQQKLQATKQKLINVSKQLQQQTFKNQIMSLRSHYSIQQKNKQRIKVSDLKQQCQMSQILFKTTTQQYNSFISNSRHELSVILSKFQTQYVQRVEKMVDNLKKLMVFQTAMMRNFDYDIININNQVQTVNIKKDILDFVEQHKQVKKVIKIQTNTKEFTQSLLEDIESNEFQKKLSFQKNQQLRLLIQDHIKGSKEMFVKSIVGYNQQSYEQFNHVIRIVDFCWRDDSQIGEELADFKKLVQVDQNRYLFYKAFKQYKSFFNKDMKKQTAALFQIIVLKSVQKKDIYTLRKLLAVVFSQWKAKQPNSKPKQLLLYRAIQGNTLWKNQDFWDTIIFESIQQKLKLLLTQKGQTLQQKKMKQQNAILSELASYCHIMIMLGTSQKTVKLIVGKYCRLHGLGQEQNKVLSKTISQTLTTYKEFN